MNQALERLSAGNTRYLEGRSEVPPGHRAIERARPFAAVLACSDSRFIPERLFDVGAGELFIVRAAGNTASESAIASLEFACLKQQVDCIVVLGHSDCQAVIGACDKVPADGALGALLNSIGKHLPAALAGAAETDHRKSAIQMHARKTAARLSQESACLKQRVAAQTLAIIPAYCALADGRVTWLEPAL